MTPMPIANTRNAATISIRLKPACREGAMGARKRFMTTIWTPVRPRSSLLRMLVERNVAGEPRDVDAPLAPVLQHGDMAAGRAAVREEADAARVAAGDFLLGRRQKHVHVGRQLLRRFARRRV